MTQSFPVHFYAKLILSGKGIFVREIANPKFPEYFFFRVLENPTFSETFVSASEEEVRYNCGGEDHEEYAQNREELKTLLKVIDQMRSKQPVPMEGKVIERQALEI